MTPEIVAVGCAAGLILVAAWQDFRDWKIRNWTVLALLAAYISLALWRWIASSDGFQGTAALGDLGAGMLLFGLGFAFWVVKLFGAGDAKLLLPVGLFVGFSYLVPFALALTVVAAVVFLALRFPVPAIYQVWPTVARIEEIRRTGKVPYGVVIAAAALFAMYLRYSRGLS